PPRTIIRGWATATECDTLICHACSFDAIRCSPRCLPWQSIPIKFHNSDTLAIARMVDLHHHLLPGLDDGSPNLETSVAMARIAAEDGITHVVATPHANNVYSFDPDRIAGRIEALRSALAAEAIPLTISSG